MAKFELIPSKDLEKVLNEIARQTKKISRGVGEGLLKGALHIKGISQRNTPVGETGNLKASAFVQPRVPAPVITIGYTADYALPVHEILENRHEVGQAKFLEFAVLGSKKKVLQFIQESARVKP